MGYLHNFSDGRISSVNIFLEKTSMKLISIVFGVRGTEVFLLATARLQTLQTTTNSVIVWQRFTLFTVAVASSKFSVCTY